ncbi:Ppx/GppA phosphatase family protein [Nesterenkonia xinjiangensis]|uniref:Exopolyphosphatase/guanosine-5'-triphosphate, 3'-diphosphate pyrophosphatase n=1 Tax=Nesterenkonia xinjiangensis TaxID=225327 RepID=A0A7Z0GLM2_9MICC|nr:Ppx/GppA phosphatase family protein [Nesterenkonia xinjiangensis]NYJ77113.1 exopolyphosphatase/guanosine-5'-triphosphate,3'-diphosphate pyrophosphatase [Nesterenkonia xinjiangensis]
MRVAAIDCGTNSIRLLIADVEGAGDSVPDEAEQPVGTDTGERSAVAQMHRSRLTDVVRQMTVVRLGEGVDETGEFSAGALERTFAAVDSYAALIRRHKVEAVRFVATSATRDVKNRAAFVEGVRDRLGVEPEVIRGSEEAGLSFVGASSLLDWDPDRTVLVVDLGGGSTEFVLGTSRGMEHAISTDMGCVRFTERHMRTDPPQETETSMASFETLSFLEDVGQVMPLDETDVIIGVAGTVTTVTAHALNLEDYDPDLIHGAEVGLDRIHQSVDQLVHSTRDQRAQMPFMHPGRVDVIGAGALIWGTILDYVNKVTKGRVTTTLTSEHDILDGIALSIATGAARETAHQD